MSQQEQEEQSHHGLQVKAGRELKEDPRLLQAIHIDTDLSFREHQQLQGRAQPATDSGP